MIDVSIIIPTFNRERFLGAAIDSALAQGDGVEVIVVDDGSTDGSAALLSSYGERIRVLRQANQGPSAARNLGAAQACGDYLFFLDSDDLIEPGAVRALLAEARAVGSHRVPFGRAITIDEAGLPTDGVTYGFPHLPPGHELSLADLLSGIMPLWLPLLRRASYIEAGSLNPDLRLGEDQELAIRLHQSGLRFIATGIQAIRLRVHGDPRLSGAGNHAFAEGLVRLWRRIVSLVADTPDFDEESKRSLARVIWVAGRDAARAKSRVPAEVLFALAIDLDPQVKRIGPRPLRLASRVVGPYRAERVANFAKAALRRS